jgi:hypothetical protein
MPDNSIFHPQAILESRADSGSGICICLVEKSTVLFYGMVIPNGVNWILFGMIIQILYAKLEEGYRE